MGSIAVAVAAVSAFSLNNGQALTPPMGWNTFNSFGGNWDINTIKAVTDSLVANGLKDCGYNYVNCDGNDGGDTPYWPGKTGFVNWATPFAQYVHSKGMKFGVYMSATTNPQQCTQDLIAVGAEFIKHDAWTSPPTASEIVGMRDALVASGKPIVYSLHSSHEPLPAYANMWRTGRDIEAQWDIAILEDYNSNYGSLSSVGPGAWADPDMLPVGCLAESGPSFTAAEDRAIFSMWCMMAAPLIIGYDVSQTGTKSTAARHAQTIAIFSNIEVIAVDQDPLGKAGSRIKGQGTKEVWTKPLQDGTKAVAFFNMTGSAGDINITQTELGWGSASKIYVRDLWLHQDQPTFTGTFTKNVGTHAVEIYKMGLGPVEVNMQEMRKMDRSVEWLKGRGYDVFPRKLVPSVLAGIDTRMRMFDVRGRTVVSRAAGESVFILQAATQDRAAIPVVLPSGVRRAD